MFPLSHGNLVEVFIILLWLGLMENFHSQTEAIQDTLHLLPSSWPWPSFPAFCHKNCRIVQLPSPLTLHYTIPDCFAFYDEIWRRIFIVLSGFVFIEISVPAARTVLEWFFEPKALCWANVTRFHPCSMIGDPLSVRLWLRSKVSSFLFFCGIIEQQMFS